MKSVKQKLVHHLGLYPDLIDIQVEHKVEDKTEVDVSEAISREGGIWNHLYIDLHESGQ